MNPSEGGDRDEPSLLRVQPKPQRQVTKMDWLERPEDQGEKKADATASNIFSGL